MEPVTAINLRLYIHQERAIQSILAGKTTIVSTPHEFDNPNCP
jgi:ATP-dependent helicase YprA (DUF1998 family)